jgi:hypothetical protein
VDTPPDFRSLTRSWGWGRWSALTARTLAPLAECQAAAAAAHCPAQGDQGAAAQRAGRRAGPALVVLGGLYGTARLEAAAWVGLRGGRPWDPGPKLLRLLKREGFRHATRDMAPHLPGNALQSLTCGGSLHWTYCHSPRVLERPTAVRPGAVRRRSSGAARIVPTPSAVSGLGPPPRPLPDTATIAPRPSHPSPHE